MPFYLVKNGIVVLKIEGESNSAQVASLVFHFFCFVFSYFTVDCLGYSAFFILFLFLFSPRNFIGFVRTHHLSHSFVFQESAFIV